MKNIILKYLLTNKYLPKSVFWCWQKQHLTFSIVEPCGIIHSVVVNETELLLHWQLGGIFRHLQACRFTTNRPIFAGIYVDPHNISDIFDICELVM